MKSTKTALADAFGPQSLLPGAMQMGGELTRGVLVSKIEQLVDEFFPATSHLGPHTSWSGTIPEGKGV